MRFGIIGNGKLAMDCIKFMQKHGEGEIAFLMYDPKLDDPSFSISTFCEERGIQAIGNRKVNSHEAVELMREAAPDYLLSINNYRILKAQVLSLPPKGVINFHNGPLPYYKGVNIPSWAILNGESSHGITWHFVEEGIDTGDIILQRNFEVDEDMTASRLMIKCIREGVKGFKELYPKLLSGEFDRQPQTEEGSYFSLKDYPENQGVLDVNWNFDKIDRMVKGLHLFPFTNGFVYAKIELEGTEYIVGDVERIRDRHKGEVPGSVTQGVEGMEMVCGDCVLRFEQLFTLELEEIE